MNLTNLTEFKKKEIILKEKNKIYNVPDSRCIDGRWWKVVCGKKIRRLIDEEAAQAIWGKEDNSVVGR